MSAFGLTKQQLVKSEKQLTYSELYFDSKNFETGSINRPNWLLTSQMQGIKKIKVGRIAIPFSYFIVNATNQVFTFEEIAGGGEVSFNLTNGNYNSTTLPALLKAGLDTNSVNGYTYTVSVVVATNKLLITSTGAFQVDIATSKFITGYTTATGSATSHTADNVLNLSGTNNLYLRSNLASFLARDSIIFNRNSHNNILSQIPMNANSGDIVYQEYESAEYLDISTDIYDIEFYLTDSDDNIIDLNGKGFSITLFTYKEVSTL